MKLQRDEAKSKLPAAPLASGDAGAAASCTILDPSSGFGFELLGWDELELLSNSRGISGVCILSHVTAKKKVKMTYSTTRGGRSRIQRQDAFRLIK